MPDLLRSLVRRLAYNYECSDSVESRTTAALNQKPRLFRDAFVRAIEEEIDHLLSELAQSFLPADTSGSSVRGTSCISSPFLMFYYSDEISDKLIDEDESSSSDDEKSTFELRAADVTASNPPLASTLFTTNRCKLNGQPQQQSPRRPFILGYNLPTKTLKSVYSSARTFMSDRYTLKHSIDCNQRNQAKNKKKSKKNAVVAYSVPKIFQRVTQICGSTRDRSIGKEASADTRCNAESILHTIIPFVKAWVPLFYSAKSVKIKHIRRRHRAQLKFMHWKNFHLPTPKPRQQYSGEVITTDQQKCVDLLAWKRDKCLLFYPVEYSENNSLNQDRNANQEQISTKAIAAAFDTAELLVHAILTAQI